MLSYVNDDNDKMWCSAALRERDNRWRPGDLPIQQPERYENSSSTGAPSRRRRRLEQGQHGLEALVLATAQPFEDHPLGGDDAGARIAQRMRHVGGAGAISICG